MQKMLGFSRKAIDTYNMIEEGDKIAVGVSGGKDSVVLLTALSHLKKFYPKSFRILAITIDMGYEGTDFSEITKLCSDLGVEYIIEKTEIKQIVFDIRNEKNPCSLCANLRRGALNNAAMANGCNKVALGHHFDDVIETFMMNLTYNGNIGCFDPVTELERSNLKVIRPLIFTPEWYVSSVLKRYGLPVVKNPCPADKNTKREEIKNLILKIEKENPDVKKRIFAAVNSLDGWKIGG